ncbi:MAG: SpoIIE family protein phosphatase [Clostridiales bacterium]|jgi:serine phosphatase RsbU (regulator of sigma subunit)|nr:SpoIIE family protein phosphatase [Clostridiales bacterium]
MFRKIIDVLGQHQLKVLIRNVNRLMFFIAAAIMLFAAVTLVPGLLKQTTEEISPMLALRAAEGMSALVDHEATLLEKAANSNAVIEWLADEDNPEKVLRAAEELNMLSSLTTSGKLYVIAGKSQNEYLFQKTDGNGESSNGKTPERLPEKEQDPWYFESLADPAPYRISLGLDKTTSRNSAFLDYKIISGTEVLGVLHMNLDFGFVLRRFPTGLDKVAVRSIVVDEKGMIIFDSRINYGESFLQNMNTNSVDSEFSGTPFLDILHEYLAKIENVFGNNAEAVTVKGGGMAYDLIVISPVKAMKWSIISLCTPGHVFTIINLIPWVVVIIFLFIAILLISNTFIKRSVIKPLESLNISIENYKYNRRTRLEGTERRDEIGSLANTIEEMYERFNAYNADLENKVRERSAHLKAAKEDAERLFMRVSEQNETIMESINYASKIQRSLIPGDQMLESFFADYSVIWKPRDIVGGDVYWVKRFNDGLVLCACDCTGHGTPGALLTMLVVSAFESFVSEANCKDTARIIWELDQRLSAVLKVESNASTIREGCDLAVLFIYNDRSVAVSSCNTRVYICDGSEVKKVKGQKLYVGEGKMQGTEHIQTTVFEPMPGNKVYIASDGLYDQVGGANKLPFGYNQFRRLILENHHESQSVITDRVWRAFEDYRGEEPRRDDFQLISFQL